MPQNKKMDTSEGFYKMKKAYLFDVDGVLTDPIEKHVTNPELFTQLIERL